MKKIHVQSKMTKAQAMTISGLCILIVLLGIVFLIISADYYSHGVHGYHGRGRIFGLIFLLAAFPVVLIKETKKSEEYVSELQLTSSELAVVYKKDKDVTKITRINLDNIENIHAKLTAEAYGSISPSSLYCQTDVSIKTKDHNLIHFTEIPTTCILNCKYSFMLRLLAVAKELPNFTFCVKGDSKTTKKDIKHFSKYGRRLNRLKIFYMEFKNYSASTQIKLIFVLIVLILLILFILFSQLIYW